MSSRDEAEDEDSAPTAWISRAFEELVASRDPDPPPEQVDFDVVIVGSGYGGAIAAARLAGATDRKSGDPIRVCVLERGREYLPGMFPPRLADLAGHVRFCAEGARAARGEREGLFDVRAGADVSAIVANGLGGGSLINAGVMAEPAGDVFQRPEWPERIRDEAEAVRNKRFAEVREMLGAAVGNNVLLNPGKVPAKFRVLERMAPDRDHFKPASITVALTPNRVSSANVELNECKRCGDCATGCNYGAKDSLDVNLLRTAEQAGACIYTGATVLRLERRRIADGSDGWLLDVVHTHASLRARQGGPFRLVARNAILAAGTFGSTEILLRSERTDDIVFSARLGQRFSTNGDMIAAIYDQRDPRRNRVRVNAVADERDPPDGRKVGPTITGIIDLRDSGGVVIEEMAVPGPLRRVFEEVVTTVNVLRSLGDADTAEHSRRDDDRQDPCAVDGEAIRSSSLIAIMGDDHARGALELVGADDEADGDGAIRVRWPEGRDETVFGDGIEALHDLSRTSDVAGKVQPNPAWQLLPDDMQDLFDYKRGPLLTVHPLGGCPMGESGQEEPAPEDSGKPRPVWGVVNDLGQVFDATSSSTPRAVYANLAVLDGSIVPTSLGINPSLTIAMLAYRAVELLRDEWKYDPPAEPSLRRSVRPVFRAIPDPAEPRPTLVDIVERMSGDAMLPARGGGTVAARIELTLRFEQRPLEELFLPVRERDEIGNVKRDEEGNVTYRRVPMKRRFEVISATSMLRIFTAKDWHDWRRRAGKDDELDALVQVSAPLSGALEFMHHEASTYRQRRCRALRAWFFNRGLRDTWQGAAKWIEDWRNGIKPRPLPAVEGERKECAICGRLPFARDACRRLSRRVKQLFALASRGGEVRLFDYELKLGEPVRTAKEPALDLGPFEAGRGIAGRKRVTYSRRCNPWMQMARMSLDAFPGLAAGDAPVLELDTDYLAREAVPLMRVLEQQDEPSLLADLSSLVGYFVRLLLSVHVWSFRKPDPADLSEPQRLPGKLRCVPEPVVTEIDVGDLPDGRSVRARLTRYPRPASKKPPILMIPGYSASGTTYAHPAIKPNAVSYFSRRPRGRDVWVLDMRTSCGMPTSRLPWRFEDAALADIPAAIDHIWHATGEKRRIDILAHCMGSVMFSMAMLAPPEPGEPFFREREALPDRVGRIVLSQIGPVVVFTPANKFRAYLMNYLRAFLPLANYEFRIGPAPSLTDQLIDRVLAAMPYPESEFDIENPWWPPWRRTPWVGSRHRMDALYGRDFNVENVSPKVLDAIDDLFGPLSTETVAQVIHFARLGVVTNYAGRNVFVTRRNLVQRWKEVLPPDDPQHHRTLSIHGEENGLYDIATLSRMEKLFSDELGIEFEKESFPGLGHQDCLIGTRTREVFERIARFFDEEGEP